MWEARLVILIYFYSKIVDNFEDILKQFSEVHVHVGRCDFDDA